MATTLHLFYFRDGLIGNVSPVKKIQVIGDGSIVIKHTVSGVDEVSRFRFSRNAAIPTLESVQVGNYTDNIYRYYKETGNDLEAWIAVAVPAGTDIPEPKDQVLTYTNFTNVPIEVFLASGETNAAETPTRNPSWVPNSPLPAKRKAFIVSAIEYWRESKRNLILRSLEFSDYFPETDVVKHFALWMMGADYTLREFYNTSSSYRADTIAQVFLEAAKGPPTLDPTGDGEKFEREFFAQLKAIAGGLPLGPNDRASVWVNWYDVKSAGVKPGAIQRVDLVDDVLDTNLPEQTRQDRSKEWGAGVGDTFDDYDPTLDYWS